MKHKEDWDLVCTLIHQVQKASGGMSEQRVTTYITRPLWNRWNEHFGQTGEPTDWCGINKTNRIYGSKTFVVERDFEACVSFIDFDSKGPDYSTDPFSKPSPR